MQRDLATECLGAVLEPGQARAAGEVRAAAAVVADANVQNAVTGGHLDIGAGSLLGLAALLDANPDLDAGALADEYAARVLRACGLSKAEAAQLASRPLPDLTSFAQPAPAPASEPL